MSDHYIIYTGLTILATVFVLVAMEWFHVKRLVQVCLIGLILAFNVIVWTVKGTPYNILWFDLLQRQEKSVVLHYVLIEDKGIYYWLMPDGAKEPFYLQRPWNQKEAQALQERYREARRGNMHLEFNPEKWIEEHGKRRPEFNLRQMEPPMKDMPDSREGGTTYDHPGYDI